MGPDYEGCILPQVLNFGGKKGTKASWAWASLLEGIDFLKEYIQWQVMNGEDINIWRDKWIPGIALEGSLEIENEEQPAPQKVCEIIGKEDGS